MLISAAEEGFFRTGGRNLIVDGIRYLNYSGSFIEFIFTGTRVTARLKSVGFADCETLQAWAAVFVDGAEEPARRFRLAPDTTEDYLLYEAETPRTITLRLVRMSEAAFAKMGIVSLEVSCEENGAPQPTKPLARRIEFVGDSITCGYGNEGVLDVDCFKTSQENPMKAYAVRTAAALQAEYQLVSWSGIGVISGWVEETVNEPSDGWLMPFIYPYTDAGWSNELGIPQAEWEQWDSSRFVPDAVVVNLGTNDCSYTRGIAERVEAFGNAYYTFLKTIRTRNPQAYIVCTLGAMGQELCPEIERQVRRFAEREQDSRIAYMPFAVQRPEDGTGADSHPSLTTHEKMARKLSGMLKQTLDW